MLGGVQRGAFRRGKILRGADVVFFFPFTSTVRPSLFIFCKMIVSGVSRFPQMHGPEAGLVEEEEYTLDDDDDTTDGDDDEDDDNEADDGQGPVGPLPSPSVRDVVSLSGADEVDYFFCD